MPLPRLLRRLLPLLVLAAFGLLAVLLVTNPPAAQRGGPPPEPRISVAVLQVQPQAYQVQLASYGRVQPRTQSMLVAQVAGQITEVAPAFHSGGFFARDDVLLRIDPRDYQANVHIAEAALADARQTLAEEQARAAQAKADWQRLGKSGEPGALVLRQPQMLAAGARVASAEASLGIARLQLERTNVRAPFAGRILSKQADLGQVVNAGAQLVEVYATDFVEVRLPLRNSDLAFIELPEAQPDSSSHGVAAVLRSALGAGQDWTGMVLRTEGAIDASSRQLHVVAQVTNPFSAADGRRPLKIGEYLTVELAGRVINDALVVPASTVYQGRFVWVVDQGTLQRRDVRVDWQNGADAVIGAGLAAGDQVVLTPLGQVTSGLAVRLLEPDLATGSSPETAGGSHAGS